MVEINSLNVTDDSNTARFPEGMSPAAVNNAARALEGMLARWLKDTNGSVAVSGTDTYTATINADTGFSLYDGFVFCGDFANANTGAATLNLTPDGGSALGAVAIKKNSGVALGGGEIAAGQKVLMIYDGSNFQILSHILPYRPAFLVLVDANKENQTGNGTAYTIPFATEVIDVGGNFSSTTFTAPVTGTYHFDFSIRIYGVTAAADSVLVELVTSNRTYEFSETNTNNLGGLMTISGSTLADMESSDTAFLRVTVSGESSDVVDIAGVTTRFSGFLL